MSLVARYHFQRPVAHGNFRKAIPVADTPSALPRVIEDHIKDHLERMKNKNGTKGCLVESWSSKYKTQK